MGGRALVPGGAVVVSNGKKIDKRERERLLFFISPLFFFSFSYAMLPFLSCSFLFVCFSPHISLSISVSSLLNP